MTVEEADTGGAHLSFMVDPERVLPLLQPDWHFRARPKWSCSGRHRLNVGGENLVDHLEDVFVKAMQRSSAAVYTVLLGPPYLICICMGQLHEIDKSTSEVSSLCRIWSL
jgi:hypothetical protein